MFTLVFSMIIFSLSMSISPGPVNLTILSTSMNYGFKQSLAFISGATIGFTLLLITVCFGLYQMILLFPILLNIIAILGTVLLVWMGWKIINEKGEAILADEKSLKSVPRFMHGALMQWLNPKAWIAAVSGTALFSTSQNSMDLALFIIIYFIICYISLIIWGIAGDKLARFLNTVHRAKIFNVTMGLVLIMIALEMCWKHFYQ